MREFRLVLIPCQRFSTWKGDPLTWNPEGDPQSPYIFILCGEVLSRLCRRAQRNGHLSGLKVATPAPQLNHLLFADDTMFFMDTDEQSCASLMKILQQYKMSSGQLINTDKSSISFSAKTPQVIRERVKSHLEISQEGGVGKYLGLLDHFGRRKKRSFHKYSGTD